MPGTDWTVLWNRYYGNPLRRPVLVRARPWYGDRYDGRSARELAEDQARARQRLLRQQQERRENLLDRQRERRENRQVEGTWREKNVRYQQQQRKNQQERFHRERDAQRKRQDGAWDRD